MFSERLFFLLAIALVMGSNALAQCIKPTPAAPYIQDFENTLGSWAPGGFNAEWNWGNPSKLLLKGAASGTKCWVTGSLTGTGYSGQNGWIESPCFDLTALTSPFITFKLFYDTERLFDGASFQYSTNDGASWTALGTTASGCPSDNWYNTNSINVLGATGWSGNTRPTSECAGGAGGGKGQWVTVRHSLSVVAGASNVKFRLRFGAGTICNNYDGIAFDDLYIGNAPPNNAAFNYTCNGGFKVSFSPANINCGSTVVWNFGDPASGATNTSTDINTQHQYDVGGAYTVTLTVSHPSVPTVSSQFTINLFNAIIQSEKPISCSGSKDGILEVLTSSPGLAYTYAWQTTPPRLSDTLKDVGAGTYTVTVKAPDACAVTTTATISDPPAMTTSVTFSQPSCNLNNGSINVEASGGVPPYQYIWSPLVSSSNTASGLGTGDYNIRIKDQNLCEDTADVKLTNGGNLGISLGADTLFCPGDTLVLYPGSFTSYRWQNGSTDSIFKVTRTGTYFVKVTDAGGCNATDTIKVTVNCNDIFFPSAFTPNADGRNDGFGAIGNINAATDYRLNVYDRWGNLVFSTADVSERWDGRVKNQVITGTYIYSVSYTLAGRGARRKQGTLVLVM